MVTAPEAALLRRAVVLIVELERREAAFAQTGQIDDESLVVYQTVSNSLRRLLESVGLARRQRDITPTLDQYLAERYPAEDITSVESSKESAE
jgi:hypothetical protein